MKHKNRGTSSKILVNKSQDQQVEVHATDFSLDETGKLDEQSSPSSTGGYDLSSNSSLKKDSSKESPITLQYKPSLQSTAKSCRTTLSPSTYGSKILKEKPVSQNSTSDESSSNLSSKCKTNARVKKRSSSCSLNFSTPQQAIDSQLDEEMLNRPIKKVPAAPNVGPINSYHKKRNKNTSPQVNKPRHFHRSFSQCDEKADTATVKLTKNTSVIVPFDGEHGLDCYSSGSSEKVNISTETNKQLEEKHRCSKTVTPLLCNCKHSLHDRYLNYSATNSIHTPANFRAVSPAEDKRPSMGCLSKHCASSSCHSKPNSKLSVQSRLKKINNPKYREIHDNMGRKSLDEEEQNISKLLSEYENSKLEDESIGFLSAGNASECLCDISTSACPPSASPCSRNTERLSINLIDDNLSKEANSSIVNRKNLEEEKYCFGQRLSVPMAAFSHLPFHPTHHSSCHIHHLSESNQRYYGRHHYYDQSPVLIDKLLCHSRNSFSPHANPHHHSYGNRYSYQLLKRSEEPLSSTSELQATRSSDIGDSNISWEYKDNSEIMPLLADYSHNSHVASECSSPIITTKCNPIQHEENSLLSSKMHTTNNTSACAREHESQVVEDILNASKHSLNGTGRASVILSPPLIKKNFFEQLMKRNSAGKTLSALHEDIEVSMSSGSNVSAKSSMDQSIAADISQEIENEENLDSVANLQNIVHDLRNTLKRRNSEVSDLILLASEQQNFLNEKHVELANLKCQRDADKILNRFCQMRRGSTGAHFGNVRRQQQLLNIAKAKAHNLEAVNGEQEILLNNAMQAGIVPANSIASSSLSGLEDIIIDDEHFMEPENDFTTEELIGLCTGMKRTEPPCSPDSLQVKGKRRNSLLTIEHLDPKKKGAAPFKAVTNSEEIVAKQQSEEYNCKSEKASSSGGRQRQRSNENLHRCQNNSENKKDMNKEIDEPYNYSGQFPRLSLPQSTHIGNSLRRPSSAKQASFRRPQVLNLRHRSPACIAYLYSEENRPIQLANNGKEEEINDKENQSTNTTLTGCVSSAGDSKSPILMCSGTEEKNNHKMMVERPSIDVKDVKYTVQHQSGNNTGYQPMGYTNEAFLMPVSPMSCFEHSKTEYSPISLDLSDISKRSSPSINKNLYTDYASKHQKNSIEPNYPTLIIKKGDHQQTIDFLHAEAKAWKQLSASLLQRLLIDAPHILQLDDLSVSPSLLKKQDKHITTNCTHGSGNQGAEKDSIDDLHNQHENSDSSDYRMSPAKLKRVIEVFQLSSPNMAIQTPSIRQNVDAETPICENKSKSANYSEPSKDCMTLQKTAIETSNACRHEISKSSPFEPQQVDQLIPTVSHAQLQTVPPPINPISCDGNSRGETPLPVVEKRNEIQATDEKKKEKKFHCMRLKWFKQKK